MLRPFAKHVLLFFSYGLLGVLLTLIVVLVLMMQGRPELQPWHVAALQSEFLASKAKEVTDLNAYLALESRLFGELETEVFDLAPAAQQRSYHRFANNSRSDARGYAVNWNRTLVRKHPNSRGAVLLLHGLSDAPYSLRSLAELIYGQGYSVLALRLPGHGTAPAALLRTKHQDWMAAMRLAMRHLASQSEADAPLYIVGYSTGAALAVEYAAARLQGEALPEPAGLVLLSPAIGVSPLAALAVWLERISALPGLAKLAWTDILPEYDPYKYNSFTANASKQVYQLTLHIGEQLQALSGSEGVVGMPPILAFQSVADATVSAPAVLQALFLRLAPERHELVAFDINRNADVSQLLAQPVADVRTQLLQGPLLPVDLTLVTNAHEETDALVAIRRAAQSEATTTERLELRWPARTYSLSHVAVPFPSNDPIYGAVPDPDSDGIFLGNVAFRGESDLLAVSATSQLRLRHNPFFPYLEQRLIEFLGGG
ncbi:MAG: alpha/beta hydrolase [Pseudomonadales bacterium]